MCHVCDFSSHPCRAVEVAKAERAPRVPAFRLNLHTSHGCRCMAPHAPDQCDDLSTCSYGFQDMLT